MDTLSQHNSKRFAAFVERQKNDSSTDATRAQLTPAGVLCDFCGEEMMQSLHAHPTNFIWMAVFCPKCGATGDKDTS